MPRKLAAPDWAVAEIAARQHGLIASAQLRRAGFSESAISRAVALGRLHRLHQGVYAVGHPAMPWERRWMAAVLACCGYRGVDPGEAFLSHRSAAALWQLLPKAPGPVDVAIVGESGRARRPGLRIHRPRTLESGMTTLREGIPVTDPARTISDLRRARPSRGGATAAQVRRALRQASVLGLGIGNAVPERTRSELEHRFLALCARHRIPSPEVNVRIDGFEVDFLWREQKLIVETDGYRYHRGPIALDDDRRRDLALRAGGFDLIRLTYTQVTNESQRVAATLRQSLERAGG